MRHTTGGLDANVAGAPRGAFRQRWSGWWAGRRPPGAGQPTSLGHCQRVTPPGGLTHPPPWRTNLSTRPTSPAQTEPGSPHGIPYRCPHESCVLVRIDATHARPAPRMLVPGVEWTLVSPDRARRDSRQNIRPQSRRKTSNRRCTLLLGPRECRSTCIRRYNALCEVARRCLPAHVLPMVPSSAPSITCRDRLARASSF